jgi:hypothetical protein
VATKFIKAYNNAISKKSGRSLKKPRTPINRTVFVPKELVDKTLSYRVGPLYNLINTRIIAINNKISATKKIKLGIASIMISQHLQF